jgi:hypothetical protein
MANINELLESHVTLEMECIDRLYLNGYLPRLATDGGPIRFLTEHLGRPIPRPCCWAKSPKDGGGAERAGWDVGRNSETKKRNISTRRSTAACAMLRLI